MSTAANFVKRHGPVPFCIPVFDFTSLDLSQYPFNIFFVRGLTLEEACHLYWNWETLTLAFTIGSVAFDNSGDPGHTVSAAFTSTALAGTARQPRQRVCGVPTAVKHLDLAATITDGETTDITGEENEDLVASLESLPDSASVGPPDAPPIIFRETGGDYVFCFHLRAIGKYLALGGGGTWDGDPGDGGLGLGGARIGSPTSVGVLGGAMDVYPCFIDPLGDMSSLYDSGGSLSGMTFTPGFYTYP